MVELTELISDKECSTSEAIGRKRAVKYYDPSTDEILMEKAE